MLGGSYPNAKHSWERLAGGVGDEQIQRAADWVHSIAPAQAFVSVRHEADHFVKPELGNYPEAFVTLWLHVRRIFRERGASNAVWVWDVSAQISDDEHFQNALRLWPGDAQVDWVAFNM